jgi:D-alanyl-D-alanine carboxypeptidase (penicillin-binding protein 5/6)
MIRRIIIWMLCGLLGCLSSSTAYGADAPPLLPARAYLLMDAASGRVLYEHNGSQQLPLASTTKIMTALVALERGKLADIVTVGQKPYDTGGSTIYLDVGEQQTLENLLYALLLESANDAAVAIAEHIGGTEEGFVAMMNEKAKAIGATRTHFANSHGLHDPNHYSTAYDLALIARYAKQNIQFQQMIMVEEKEIAGFKQNPPRKLHNHNQLLGFYAGANGVKNGYTEEALQTNVASAKRGNTELIAVVLGAQDRLWSSSMALLDYGFSHFETQQFIKQGEQVGRATLPNVPPVVAVAAVDVAAALGVGAPPPDEQIEWDPQLQLPLAAGAHLGTARWVDSQGVLGSVDLISPTAVIMPLAAMANLTPTLSVHGWPYRWGMVIVGALLVLALLTFYRRKRSPRSGYGRTGRASD